MTPLTAAEIGAFLGITGTSVRSIIHRKEIQPVGKQGRAHLYDPAVVIRHATSKDRRAA